MNAPTVTVKDVWRGGLPEGTELLAGGAGLERRVDWACALRTRAPAFETVKGGEIAFVPVRSIRLLDERLDLPQVMGSFAEKGGVAVAVLGDVSPDSIEVADRLVMPLLRLPDSVHIADAHHGCVRFILDQRAVLHERAQELQSSLMELAMAGASPAAIIDRLADITTLVAVWQDESGEVRHAAGADGDAAASALHAAASALTRWGDTITVLAADPPVREFSLDGAELSSLTSPIPARVGVGGFVSVVGDENALDQVARLAVARAASACAIELDRERAVVETRDRLEGECIESLLGGSYSSEQAVSERARRLGVDLSTRFVVVALRGSRPLDVPWQEAALRAARNVMTRRDHAGLVAPHEGAVSVLLSVGDAGDDTVERIAITLRDESAQVSGDTGVALGLGRPHTGAAGVRTSYREAEHALAMGRSVLGAGRAVSFAHLGLHRLLFAMAQHPELLDFYRDSVGELVSYDERNGADLMSTLEAYFAAHGSPTDTAQRLGVHRNTVLYRLRRIEEIGRLRLDDPAARLNLHLCLRIREVLAAG